MAAPKKYPDELRERAVRLYRTSNPRPTFRALAEQLGVHHEALRNWARQAEADAGEREDRPISTENEELRRQRKENAELKRANRSSRRRALFRQSAERVRARLTDAWISTATVDGDTWFRSLATDPRTDPDHVARAVLRALDAT